VLLSLLTRLTMNICTTLADAVKEAAANSTVKRTSSRCTFWFTVCQWRPFNTSIVSWTCYCIKGWTTFQCWQTIKTDQWIHSWSALSVFIEACNCIPKPARWWRYSDMAASGLLIIFMLFFVTIHLYKPLPVAVAAVGCRSKITQH